MTLVKECKAYPLVRSFGRKTRVTMAVSKMVNEVKTIFKKQVRKRTTTNRDCAQWIRKDGGGEYIVNSFREWITKQGIVQEMKAAY